LCQVCTDANLCVKNPYIQDFSHKLLLTPILCNVYFYRMFVLFLIIFVLTKIFNPMNIFYYKIKYYFRNGGAVMIDYSPFWDTLQKSDDNWYTLTTKYHMSNSTLHRLKHNKDVSTKTLNDLCRILDCNVCDIVRYIPSSTDQPL